MRRIVTIIAAVGTFVFASLFVGLFTGDLLSGAARFGISLGIAALAGWITWAKFDSYGEDLSSLLRAMLIGGVVVGGIGFACGFFGPILLTPDANQGPLLGIFITGPIGFVLGALGGGYLWKKRRSHSPPQL